jgi:hypothetical protein
MNYVTFISRYYFYFYLSQNLPSYRAHMHMSLSQGPQTAMHVYQIT